MVTYIRSSANHLVADGSRVHAVSWEKTFLKGGWDLVVRFIWVLDEKSKGCSFVSNVPFPSFPPRKKFKRLQQGQERPGSSFCFMLSPLEPVQCAAGPGSPGTLVVVCSWVREGTHRKTGWVQVREAERVCERERDGRKRERGLLCFLVL